MGDTRASGGGGQLEGPAADFESDDLFSEPEPSDLVPEPSDLELSELLLSDFLSSDFDPSDPDELVDSDLSERLPALTPWSFL